MAALDVTVPATATPWQRGIAATEVAVLSTLLLLGLGCVYTRSASQYLALRSYPVIFAVAVAAAVSLYAPVSTLIGLGTVSCDVLTYCFIVVHICLCSGPLANALGTIAAYTHARSHGRMYMDAQIVAATTSPHARPPLPAVPSIAVGSLPADTPLSLPSHRSVAPGMKSILKAASVRNMVDHEPQPVEAGSPPPASSRGMPVAGSSRNLNLNLYRPTSMRTLPIAPAAGAVTASPTSTARDEATVQPLSAADLDAVPVALRLEFPPGLEPSPSSTDPPPRIHASGDVFIMEMVETVVASQSVFGPAGFRLMQRAAVVVYISSWIIVAIILAAQPANATLPLNAGATRCPSYPWKGGLILFGILDVLYLIVMLVLAVIMHRIRIRDELHLDADLNAFISCFAVAAIIFYASEGARSTGTSFVYNSHSVLTALCMASIIIFMLRPAAATFTQRWAPILTSAIDPGAATPRVDKSDAESTSPFARFMACICGKPHTPRGTHSSVSTVEVRSHDTAEQLEAGGDVSAALGKSRVRSSLIVTESRSVRSLMDLALKDSLGRFLFASHAQRSHVLLYLIFYVEAIKFRRTVTPFIVAHNARAAPAGKPPPVADPTGGRSPVSSRSSSRDTAARYAPPHVGAQRHTVCTSPLGAAVLLYQRYLNRDSVHALPLTSTLNLSHITAVETALTEAAKRASGSESSTPVQALRNPYAHAQLKLCGGGHNLNAGEAGVTTPSTSTVAMVPPDVFDDIVSIVHAHVLREAFARFMDTPAFKLWSGVTPVAVPVVTRTREPSARNLLLGGSSRNLAGATAGYNRSSATVVPLDA